jgi:hypothetical protein
MKRARMPWRREYPPSPAVDAARFQDETEPYSRHWREPPEPWPPGDAGAAAELTDGLRELPRTCTEYVRQIRTTIAALDALPSQPVPSD